MLPITDIQELAQRLARSLKNSGGEVGKIGFSSTYHETVRLYNDVSVHSDITKIPKELLSKKAPNETDEELQYRIDTYQPITPSYWTKAVGAVNRVWNEQNYSVTFDDEQVHEYFKENYPKYGSIESYFKSIITVEKLRDPNAVISVEPYDLPEKEDGSFDQSVEISPVSIVYNSDHVIYYSDDYCILLSDDRSEVKVGDKSVREGLVFKLFDDTSIWEIEQTGEKSEWKFEFYEYYRHELGYMPVWTLGGTPVKYNGETIFHSHFMSAVPLLNLAVCMHTTLDGIIAKHAYPIRAYYFEDCKNPQCSDGWITVNDDGTPKKEKCPSCGGSGKSSVFSPFRDYGIKIPEARFEGENPVQFPGVAYVEPSTNMFEWSHKTVINYIERAFAFLNIDVSNSKAQGDETALGKQIDREELMSFLLLIANELFDLLDEVIYASGVMRYGTNFRSPKIVKPSEFSIKNSSDLTSEYAEVQKSGLPAIVRTLIFNEYSAQRFANDERTLKINKVVFRADPFMTFSGNDILSRVNSGLAAKWQLILHDQIYTFIDEEIEKDPEFLSKPVSEIVPILQNRAKEIETSLAQSSTSSESLINAIPPIGGQS